MTCFWCGHLGLTNQFGFCSEACQKTAQAEARAVWESSPDGQKPMIRQWFTKRDSLDLYEAEWEFSR